MMLTALTKAHSQKYTVEEECKPVQKTQAEPD